MEKSVFLFSPESFPQMGFLATAVCSLAGKFSHMISEPPRQLLSPFSIPPARPGLLLWASSAGQATPSTPFPAPRPHLPPSVRLPQAPPPRALPALPAAHLFVPWLLLHSIASERKRVGRALSGCPLRGQRPVWGPTGVNGKAPSPLAIVVPIWVASSCAGALGFPCLCPS